MVCFVHFDLEMCFAPQWRTLFQHLNFQNWSGAGVFCMLNFASEGFRHKQMLEVFLINSAGRGMKKTWNHGDQALGAAGNTL